MRSRVMPGFRRRPRRDDSTRDRRTRRQGGPTQNSPDTMIGATKPTARSGSGLEIRRRVVDGGTLERIQTAFTIPSNTRGGRATPKSEGNTGCEGSHDTAVAVALFRLRWNVHPRSRHVCTLA